MTDLLTLRTAALNRVVAENVELRAEVKRWTEKAQEAGKAYADVNTRHHEEWNRANRLESLADRLSERCVELEDGKRAAEAEVSRLRALLAQLPRPAEASARHLSR